LHLNIPIPFNPRPGLITQYNHHPRKPSIEQKSIEAISSPFPTPNLEQKFINSSHKLPHSAEGAAGFCMGMRGAPVSFLGE
jgi:hypothetical protein